MRERLMPLALRSATAVALGLATEYALRGALNRLLAPLQRSASAVTRTVITEVIIVERARRRH